MRFLFFVSDWCVCVCTKTTLASASAFIHKQQDHSAVNDMDAWTEMRLNIRRGKMSTNQWKSLFSRVLFGFGLGTRASSVPWLDRNAHLKHGWHSAGLERQRVRTRSRRVNWLLGGLSRLWAPTRDGALSLPGSCSRQRSSHRSWEGREGGRSDRRR